MPDDSIPAGQNDQPLPPKRAKHIKIPCTQCKSYRDCPVKQGGDECRGMRLIDVEEGADSTSQTSS